MKTSIGRKKRRLLWRITNPVAKSISFFLIGLLFAGCSKPEDSAETARKVDFDACALLAEADPSSLLGESVSEASRATHDRLQKVKTPDITISHCSFSAKSSLLKSVDLMIKHVGNIENPTTGKAFTDSQQPEMKEFKIEAEEITGLGDVAVKVKMPGSFQLWVFWKKHYQMNVNINGMEDEGMALERVKRVAQLVLSRL